MLSSYIVEEEDFEYFCKEDVERMNALTKRLNNIMLLDEGFKKKFVSDLNNAMCYVSSSITVVKSGISNDRQKQ